MIKAPKKLIEVSLPLDNINEGAAYEKLPGIGAHPRGLHHWWARRPFAAARAIIFAQLVNDPGGERGWGKERGQTKVTAQQERESLFEIVRGLADWKRSNDIELLELASNKIQESWSETCKVNGLEAENMPSFYDPFCGGGAIPFEAQRLGLEVYASDINPIPVTINSLMLKIPYLFRNKSAIAWNHSNSLYQQDNRSVSALGLADDFRYYAGKVLLGVKGSISKHYKGVKITEDVVRQRPDLKSYVGETLKVISWLWANTIPSPNPAVKSKVPLVRSFKLCTKARKIKWLKPKIEVDGGFSFSVSSDKFDLPQDGTISRSGGVCLLSNTPVPFSYIREASKSGNLDQILVCLVLEGRRERVYITPWEAGLDTSPPDVNVHCNKLKIPPSALGFRIQNYGFEFYSDMFTPRQQLAISSFIYEIDKIKEIIRRDAIACGFDDEDIPLDLGGCGARAYSEAICSYLLLSVGRCIDYNNKFTGWNPSNEKIMHLFGGNKISMVWDFGEANIIENVVGGFPACVDYQSKCLETIHCKSMGHVTQNDAVSQGIGKGKVISTDPPYYDNIGYACLSDVFYSWLREPFRNIFPSFFSTIEVPKQEELVAEPFRHEGEDGASHFFMTKMIAALTNLRQQMSDYFPLTLYYAFKQSETNNFETASKGWSTFLEAIIQAGLTISGTWPLRSEQTTRLRSFGSNALASSILIVCRKRDLETNSITRRQFLKELKDELPEALNAMIGGKDGASPIAPVDLAQAAIGPGMAIFSRYHNIFEADGERMSVDSALVQINKVIDEFFNEAEGDMDSATRFCIEWFMQFGFKQSDFGLANTLAQAKGTSVDWLASAGVVDSGGGMVRLLKPEDYPSKWDPQKDSRTPVWEALHQLIRALRSGGEAEAGLLLQKMADRTESIRQLAYRLYTLCERKGWAEEARAYNELIASWHGTIEAAEQAHSKSQHPRQLTLDM